MRPNSSLKKIVTIGLFSALGIALGLLLAPVPNVELVTATIFISGQVLGIQGGILVGLLTESLYSFLSPYGIAPMPIFLAQIISMMIVGYWGGRIGKLKPMPTFKIHLITGLSGLALTLIFAILTTLAYVLFIEINTKILISSLLTGLSFYVIHILSNTGIFILIVPVVVQRLNQVIKKSNP